MHFRIPPAIGSGPRFRGLMAAAATTFLAALFVQARAGDTPPIPWDRLPRSQALSSGQKRDLATAFAASFGYGTCIDTLANCVTRPEPDPIALRVADFCAWLVASGVPAKDLKDFLEARARFANPTKTYDLRTDGRPSYGNPDAPIVIVEFAEFKCPYCQQHAPTFRKLVDDSHGKVRHVFKHFPLKKHRGTVLSSRAAEAAHRQGRFWDMYTLLFQDRDKQGRKDILAYAESLHLDMARFTQDLEDAAILNLIENEKIEGLQAGVKATPTLFIDGKRYKFRIDEAHLKNVLNEEALRLGIAPPYPDG